MQGALQLVSFKGIPVKVHWTFGFLLIFIFFIALKDDMNLIQGLGLLLYVLALFVCVVLHEFGHALTARIYNIRTKDILLSPIGGLARMENFPDAPGKELLIAIAGPMVNLILALIGASVIYILDYGFDPPMDLLDFYSSFEGFLKLFVIMNTILFLFNLIPAFPMDGGRVLRALLSFKFGKVKATNIASYLGQGLAVAFFIFGIWNQHMVLPVIALFIYFVAANERKQTHLQQKMQLTSACEIMIQNFTRVKDYDTIESVQAMRNQSQEQSFLVFDIGEELVGTLPKIYLEEAEISSSLDKVESLMSRKYMKVDYETNLEKIYHSLQSKGLSVVAITHEEKIVGLIDRDRLRGWMIKK